MWSDLSPVALLLLVEVVADVVLDCVPVPVLELEKVPSESKVHNHEEAPY